MHYVGRNRKEELRKREEKKGEIIIQGRVSKERERERKRERKEKKCDPRSRITVGKYLERGR